MKTFYYLLLFIAFCHHCFAQQQCGKDFLKTTFLNDSTEINVLLIWFPTNVGAQSTLRVCNRDTGLPLQRHCGYERLNKIGQWEEIDHNLKLINCSSIPNTCMEEPFEHYYIMKNNSVSLFPNKWRTTKMTQRGDLEEPCIQGSGVPLTRLCEYNPMQHMAQWALLSPDMRNISCRRDEQYITYNLSSLYMDVQKDSEENKVEAKKVAGKITELLTVSKNVRIAADIKITTEILKVITEEDSSTDLISDVLNVTDIVMSDDKKTITKSEEVNATSSFLKTVDDYFHKMATKVVPSTNCSNIKNGVFNMTVNATSVFYVNPTCSNITGLAIYKRRTKVGQHLDYNTRRYYSFLYMNQTLDEVISAPHLLLASYFPFSLWNKMKNYLRSVNNETVLTFQIFKNDKLFVSHTKSNERPRKNILEITISNYTGELPEDIPFVYAYPKSYLRSGFASVNIRCGYWNYSAWTKTNITTKYETVSNYLILICHSSHLTHLGAIFGLYVYDIKLEYVSMFGCALSLLGLSFIWLTALCFKSYRNEPSNKVLLNMTLALTLLMLFFILVNLPENWNPLTIKENTLYCQITGAFLHYTVTVLFFWMLIIAVLQYHRYVKVMGYDLPSNYILKFGVLAWGLPLIPVCIVAFYDSDTYKKTSHEIAADKLNHHSICYPTGDSLIYGVILPTALIMLVNLIIFLLIFCSLRRSLAKFEHHARKSIHTQVRISVMLFFLMGIPWLFGLLSRIDNSPVFIYIFCFTSTLQGFVLFLYSIIIDKPTRLDWIVLCCATSYNEKKRQKSSKI